MTIYGAGYVGQALWRFLRDHFDIQIVDPNFDLYAPDQGKYLESTKAFWDVKNPASREDFKKTKHAIVCVPTPMSEDGSCDTKIVEEILRRGDHEYYLIKSTIVPGTTEKLIAETGKKICFSPEYIGEGKYEIPFWLDLPHPTNMKLHNFHIFGGAVEVTGEFIQLWQKVAGWTARYIQTDPRTAELVKYAENMYLATKKIFCDELYEVAKAFGVDYNELKELWLLDGRIHRSMTLIFPEARGFSGKCLPKDTSAIVKAAEKLGYEPKLWKEVIASNKRFRGEA